MHWINKLLNATILLGIIVILNSCQITETVNKSNTQTIVTGPGPEDMALYKDGATKYLLLSCNDRWRKNKPQNNGIYALCISKNDTIATPLKRKKEPQRFKRLYPHGIDIVHRTQGTYLYVIHHGKGKSEIIKYKFQKQQLIFQSSYSHPWMSSPNDIVVRKNGGFFVTNDQKKRRNNLGFLFGFRSGRVLFCDENGHWSRVGDTHKFPNGIALSESENYLYISTTRGNQLFQYLLKKDGNLLEKTKIARIKGADNITLNSTNLWVTSHPKLMKFVKHARKKDPCPSVIYRIDRGTNSIKKYFYDEGEQISAASTAIEIDGYLYISPIFDNKILKVSLKKTD